MSDDRTRPMLATTAPDNGGAPKPARRGRLSRRGLLIGAGAVGLGAVALTSGIIYARGDLPFFKPTPAPNNQISHLLRRAGFGAQAGDIQSYSALGLTGAIDQLINFDSVSDNLDSRLNSLGLDLTRVPDEQRWWLLRMLYTKRPLQEKMTLFWHGVLTSSYTKVGGKSGYQYMIQQNNFLRDHCLDTYDNILLGITSDPAMMWWLDLRLSTKNAPNENYARELMELFTLGVNGGYTQDDVHNAALALTGWRLPRGQGSVYLPGQHDDSQKTLLGQTGDLDYHDVIRLVAAHPATGPFVCKRMFSFFVRENPTDSDVKPMVDAYYGSGHSIKAVVQAMLTAPSFLAPESYRARVKSPAEFVVGALRQLEVETNGQLISAVMTEMGQTIFNPPNVAGWPGDQTSAAWVNTGTWLARANFINALLDLVTGSGGPVQNIISSNNLTSPDAIVDHFTSLMIDGQISADRRQTLVGALGQGGSATGLRDMLYLLMTSPDYQLN